MKRAAIYARYSTDLQNDRSVEDQISLCGAYAERNGWKVVREYHDRAKSGASMFGRPGLAELIQAAERQEFDILVAEAPDRVSRDIADLAHVHKTLKFRMIELNCVNGGTIDTMQVGMYGVMGQMQREEGAKKVKRGMTGVVRSGRNAGGKAYGYRPIAGKKGEMEIVEEESAVIRQIFDLYTAGISPRAIAAKLNAEGVPAPRGKQWNASTINGNGKRGNGLLLNPLYAGKIIWNRVAMVKDPSTGRRISRVNDASVFEEIEAPHLRIIDQDVFDAAQRRKAEVGGAHQYHSPKNKRLLSGLLKCGACGGGMSIIGADRSGPRVVCSTRKESNTCENKARYYIEKVESDVIDRLRAIFADISVIDAYVREYEAESKRIAAERRNNRSGKERALADVQERIARVLDQVSRGTIDEEDVLAILPSMKAERAALKADLERIDPPGNVYEIKPRAVLKFKEDVENLVEVLNTKDAEPSPKMMKAFREVISSIVIYPREPGEEYRYEINGFISSITDISNMSAVLMVAGGGIEPPTSGL